MVTITLTHNQLDEVIEGLRLRAKYIEGKFIEQTSATEFTALANRQQAVWDFIDTLIQARELE